MTTTGSPDFPRPSACRSRSETDAVEAKAETPKVRSPAGRAYRPMLAGGVHSFRHRTAAGGSGAPHPPEAA
jgi:hypothetical protein